jgi:hypothetical protein
MAASALPHAPFSIALHAMIGVSERTRDVLRTLDVFFILTCGGEGGTRRLVRLAPSRLQGSREILCTLAGSCSGLWV